MKKSGASLARFALEQLGVRFTFGIPGVHNTELYDELGASRQIRPVLVTHEMGAAFMADAVSRTSATIGTLLIVPAAGVTHAASGIGEAFLAGVPMLIVAGGIHAASPYRYQLHEMDQHALLKPITKATWRVTAHRDVIPTLYEAYRTATRGVPGPVFVELPYNVSNFLGEVDDLPAFVPDAGGAPPVDRALVRQAAELLAAAAHPGLFVGWGAVDAQASLVALAELLEAPVATTLQGLSAFPGNHPLHAGMGAGAYSVPAAARAFERCDCMLAVGTRFAEIPTGSFSMRVPERLIHVDIDPAVFNANYPARIAIAGDAREVLGALLEEIRALGIASRHAGVAAAIARDKQAYRDEWLAHDSGGRVHPARFFASLRARLPNDALIVADDGNHTYLTAELMPILAPRGFLSPTDFNAMGYCVPAAIGAKLANPARTVVGIVGDGALQMTGLEMLAAVRNGVGVAVFVFHDGELSQISQAQEIPYHRKTCTVIGGLDVASLAKAMGAACVAIDGDGAIDAGIDAALHLAAEGRPVIVDVRIDYSKRTRFTKGVVKAALRRFATRDQVRYVGRALFRKVRG